MHKLKDKRGLAGLIVIMVIIIIILGLIIMVPIVGGKSEEELIRVDAEYENAARRQAKREFLFNRESFYRVYDSINKKLVEPSEIGKVEPYATSKEHEGCYIMVRVDDEGEVTITWETVESIRDHYDNVPNGS